MKLINCIITFLFLLAVGTVGINTVIAKTLYDDFSGNYVESSKWYQRDFVREVSQGKLVTKVRNSIVEENVRNTIALANPESVSTIQCDIAIMEATVDTGTNSMSFARIQGFFYNTQGSGGATGDVIALLYIGDRGSGLEAWWDVYEADDDEQNDFSELGSGTLAVPGLAYGTSYTATLEYDGDKNFTFTVEGVSASFISGPDRQRDPVTQHKGFRTGAYTDGGTGVGYVSATYDDVMINGASYDNFASGPLNQTNWQHLEFVRKIDNGKVRLTSHSTGDRENTRLTFAENYPYIEATVKIDSNSTIESGDRGIARLDGYFYNEDFGPGNHIKYQGNVWAGFYLNYYDDGTLKATVYGDKSLDADESQWDSVFGGELNLPIFKGRDYKMSIHYTGSSLIFIIKDLVTGRMDFYVHKIETSTYEPYGEYRGLLSRVYGNGSGGYMAVDFDNIYVDVAEPAATFDAAGDWEATGSNPWSISGCDDPDVSGTTDITITQNANNLTVVAHDDDGDTTFNGYVYDDTYMFMNTEVEGNETEDTYGIIVLSDNNSGSGNISVVWTDGIDTCEVGFDISISKSSTGDDNDDGGGGGGGGGCLINTLNH